MAADPARTKSLFLAALDLPDAAERAAYLDRECGGDAPLRVRVEALLCAYEDPSLPPIDATDALGPDLRTADLPSDTSPTGTFGPEAHRTNSPATEGYSPDGATHTFETRRRDGKAPPRTSWER